MEQMPVQFPFLGSDSPNFLAVLRNFIRPLYSVEARELINKGVILLFPSVFEAAAWSSDQREQRLEMRRALVLSSLTIPWLTSVIQHARYILQMEQGIRDILLDTCVVRLWKSDCAADNMMP